MSDDALIRLKNLKALNLTPTQLEERVGGRYTYWRDLLGGKKSFGEKAARKIEEALSLPRGSLDGTSEWPFPGIQPSEFEGLTRDQLIEIQGAVRKMLIDYRTAPPPAAGKRAA